MKVKMDWLLQMVILLQVVIGFVHTAITITLLAEDNKRAIDIYRYQNRSWIIHAEDPSKAVYLQMPLFLNDTICEDVHVFDGPDENAPLMHHGCNVTSNGNALFLQLDSDAGSDLFNNLSIYYQQTNNYVQHNPVQAEGNEGLTVGQIVGIVLGVVAALATASVSCVCCSKYRKY